MYDRLYLFVAVVAITLSNSLKSAVTLEETTSPATQPISSEGISKTHADNVSANLNTEKPVEIHDLAEVTNNTPETTEREATPVAEEKEPEAIEFVSVVNAITEESKSYTCRWGTFAPDVFSVRLIIDIEPGQSVSVPKKLLEQSQVRAEYDFAFNKGLASRKGTKSYVLRSSGEKSEQNLYFSWNEPRLQLSATPNA